jgi:hypothetical protein
MVLDIETVKVIQSLVTELNTTATFLTKLKESKEISFTVGGITTRILARDEEAFKPIFEAILESNNKKMFGLRDRIAKLLDFDKFEEATKREF